MLEITSANFENEVLQSEIPVLVDFWASWCPPCRAIAPLLDSLNEEADSRYKIVKVDIDVANDLAEKYKVSGIPTLILFKNGEQVQRAMGAQSKEKLLELCLS